MRLLVRPVCILMGILGVGVVSSSARMVTERAEPEVLVSGSFTVRYFGDRGRESFAIHRLDDGWTISCQLEPPNGNLQPTDTRYQLDVDRRFVRAEHRETGDGGVQVTYTLEDGRLVARGTDADGNQLPVRSVSVDSNGIVSGPNYATDFYVLYPLDLKIGASRTIDAAVFGFRTWEPEALRLTTTRKANRTIRGSGGERVECLVYRSKLEMDSSTTWATSYLDPETGEVHRLTVDLAIGSAKVVRD